MNKPIWETKIDFTFMLLFEFKQELVNNKTQVELRRIKKNSKLTTQMIECSFPWTLQIVHN